MAEEIIIKIELEKGQNEKEVDALTSKINALTKANKDLKKANNELIKSGQDNSKEFIENSRQIEINKQKITEAASSRKNLIQTIIAEDDSIKGLKARNAELIKQRDQLSTSTESGRSKIAAIDAELDKNNKTIKDNVSVLEKQKINIGNYKSALDGIVPGLGGFIGGIEGATAAAKAFIATPIGLILAAVAAALALVTSYFKNVSDGADFLEDTLTTLSTVFDVVIDRIGRFVGGLVSIINGNFAEGLDKITASFTGIGDEIEREVGLALELNQALRDLEDQEIRTAVSAAETENQIKRLLLQSRNRAISEGERIKLLEQATALEKSVNEEEIKNRTEALRIANQQAALRLNIAKEVGESEIAFGKRVLEEFTKDGAVQANDLRNRVKDSILAISGAEGESIAILEKIQNQRDALIEKQQLAAQKAAEEAEKRRLKELEDARKHQEELAALEAADEKAELERFERIRTAQEAFQQVQLEQKIKDAEDLQARVDAEIELERFKLATFLADNVLYQAEIEAATARSEANIRAIEKKAADEKRAEDKKTAELKKQQQQDQINGALAVAGAASRLIREAFGNTKEAAYAEAVINTAKGITNALASSGPPWVGIAMSIIVGALGAVQIAKIAATDFARGGLLRKFGLGGISNTGGVLRGPSHALGGIPFSVGGRPGFEAEGGEAIINKRSTAMFRKELSAINEAGGGVRFAQRGAIFQTGSVLATSQTRSATSVAEGRQSIRDSVLQFMENMPPIMVTVEDINARQQEVNDQTSKAVVI